MAHFRGARARFLTRCLLLVAALAARGQAAPAGDAQGLHFFDIPALPLAEALQRTASTGHSGLYDSGLVAGSARAGGGALHGGIGAAADAGRFGLAGALRLAGHVHARRRGGGRAGPAETLAARQRYYGKLQAAMRALLCGDPDVRPGSYRAAVSLWFGDSGQVRRVRLLDSTVRPSATSC